MPRFAEFFAGAGMVSAALRPNWDLAFANDIDAKKCQSYRTNWGQTGLIEGDISELDPKILMQPIDLYWASSPCQDLSLAGNRKGLAGDRSGLFHTWMSLVSDAAKHGFSPRILAFENVTGLISSNQGQDLIDVTRAFQLNGYRVGALEIDARWYLPHSRPRLFMIGIRNDVIVPAELISSSGNGSFHTERLRNFHATLTQNLRDNWLWWNINPPEIRKAELVDLIDTNLATTFDDAKVQFVMSMMERPSLLRISEACALGGIHVGTIYKRGRPDSNGVVRQRAEVRMDGLAGCLRTPAGGSSRQTLLIIQEGNIAMRLLSPREAVRLMGLPEDYMLPPTFNEAYKLAGDGVAVPIVRHLATALFEPLLDASQRQLAA